MNDQDGPSDPLSGLDLDVLDQMVSDLDRTIVPGLIAAFVEEMLDRVGRIQAASAAGDLAALGKEAHALKSSAGTYGAKDVYAVSSGLESACKQGDTAAALAQARDLPALARFAADGLESWRTDLG